MLDDDEHSRDLEYARGLVQLAGEDSRQVYIRVTAAVGLAALFVTQLPFDQLLRLHLWARWVLAAGLACAVASAALFFFYSSELHRARVEMLKAIRDGNPKGVPAIWAKSGTVWENTKWSYWVGTVLLWSAVVLLGVALSALLKLVP